MKGGKAAGHSRGLWVTRGLDARYFYIFGVLLRSSFCSSVGNILPEPSVLGGGSSPDDFGDEDAGVLPDVGVVRAARDAEAESRVALEERTSASAAR